MSVKHKLSKALLVGILFLCALGTCVAAEARLDAWNLNGDVRRLMQEGDIPGMTVVIVKDGYAEVKCYGMADRERSVPVTAETLFQLGSNSKAFTALAALTLERQGKLELDRPVSDYIPWFSLTYEGKPAGVTVRQLLQHTSGVPGDTIDAISPGADEAALERTVRNVAGMELERAPGTEFEYATVNYDVLGLVVQTVAGEDFAAFLSRGVLQPLRLNATQAEPAGDVENKARGYKIGFSSPRPFDAPYFRGNLPAGYILTNGCDMARWLRLQLGLIPDPFGDLIQRSHQRDETVPPAKDVSSYGMGWKIRLDGSGVIEHSGVNPTFTSYIAFNPRSRTGVAVLANSNSAWMSYIGRFLLKQTGGFSGVLTEPDHRDLDQTCLVFCLMLGLVLLVCLVFLLSIPLDLFKKRREFGGFGLKKLWGVIKVVLALIPIGLGVYLIPYALQNVSWQTALVWAPQSFIWAVALMVGTVVLGLLGFLFSSLFPFKNPYARSMPLVAVLSFLSGGANAVVIFLLSSSMFSGLKIQFQIYYFVLAFFIYILGRRSLQVTLARLTYDIVYDLRMRLLRKIFLTTYQDFESLDRGRVYATLNDDTHQIGNSANIITRLITSVVTIFGAFLYLMTIAFWATVVTLGMIFTIVAIYALAGRQARLLLEEARNTKNVFMGLLNGLLDGFKELSLRRNRKREYWADIRESCHQFRYKTVQATVKLINAFIVGESMLLVVLGAIAFAFPYLFPQFSMFTLVSFIMILLYLIGPIAAITGAIPEVLQVLVCYRRIREFEGDIPPNPDGETLEGEEPRLKPLEYIDAKGITFQYKNGGGDNFFKVGPIDFEARKGEITFIIGGNGSGKTTFAKLLTGLYKPTGGAIDLGRQNKANGHIGEYISVVFSDNHLFEKLYDVALENQEERVAAYLQRLGLDHKVAVDIQNRKYSTINLSGGQKKRLALLQCFLEDAPIYLFDEIAAEQDPEFREFFYRTLLPEMKRQGKIVIAITHDDNYFDAADKIVKMEMGRVSSIQNV